MELGNGHDRPVGVMESSLEKSPESPRSRRRLPSPVIAPTLLTLGNVIAGFAAIYFAAKPTEYSGPFGWSSLTWAAALVLVGLFLDSIDGMVARMTNGMSEMGNQLDAMADLITFGVAPAFVVLRLTSNYIGPESDMVAGPDADNIVAKVVWAIAALYVCCAALRLAKFSVAHSDDLETSTMTFEGLPSPGAAGTVVSLIILHQYYLGPLGPNEPPTWFPQYSAFIIPLVMLLCAIGMVSAIPYPHFANRFLKGNSTVSYIIRLAVVMILIVVELEVTLTVSFVVYALSGPACSLWRWMHLKKKPKSVGESED